MLKRVTADEMQPIKLLGAVAFVIAMLIAIAALGQLWINTSEPYELGRAAVGSRLSGSATSVELKRLRERVAALVAARLRCAMASSRMRSGTWHRLTNIDDVAQTTLTRGQYAPLLHRSLPVPRSTLPQSASQRHMFLRNDLRRR
ncbi:hypothetical protein, partial [Rhodoferax sp.]|uniref:hypothetical protein n=1 Tax=Rhodoferax sp. TaxID=50421 RepID=UPI003BB5C0F7